MTVPTALPGGLSKGRESIYGKHPIKACPKHPPIKMRAIDLYAGGCKERS